MLSAAAVIAACSATSVKPHGDPDPGGKRMAGLVSIAHAVMPPDASHITQVLAPSTWSGGGCDGGPAGWTYMEDVQTFQASGSVVAEIDANMNRMHWSVVPQVDAERAGPYPPSAAPGPTTPYVRRYELSRSPESPVAWLFTPQQASGSAWQLDLEAFPAEVRAADC
jgi:hypothetical protein